MVGKNKEPISKPSTKKPDLSWSEIATVAFILEHLKDRKLTKLGLNPTKLEVVRKAQKKMVTALEGYIENGK